MARIQDPGKGFLPGAVAHAAICNPEDAPTRHVEIRHERGHRPGGFGILIARSMVDELVYNERGNEVLMIKYLAPPEAGDGLNRGRYPSSAGSSPDSPSRA